MDITQYCHHYYTLMLADWRKYRLTAKGGADFRNEYLKTFSKREDANEFQCRKEMTYVPAFAKAALIEIKNSIFNRLVDVKRLGGPSSYQKVVDGVSPGVDRKGTSMNAFMGGTVLPELLAIGRVCVFVDQPKLEVKTGTKLDDADRVPYLYIYQAEQVKSWCRNANEELVSLLLEAQVDTCCPETGLVTGQEPQYRLFNKTAEGVTVTIYNQYNDQISEETFAWTMIPAEIYDIPHSLLEDVADYQIAHLNIASSDINYAWKSNFPFYTEQDAGGASAQNLRRTNRVEGDSTDGTAQKAATASDREIQVGNVKGRRYTKGTDRPDFIHPSPEPLEVSMKKQDEMKREVRQLVQLSVTNMDPRRESAESKTMDARGLEAGLSYLAHELERIERKIAEIWAMYEQSSEIAEIRYPQDYSLRTTADRIKEGEDLMKLAKNSPSQTYQKEMNKQAAEATLGNKVSSETLNKIKTEIDEASVVFVDPETLVKDVETGLATAGTVSKIRGYPEGEAEKAKKERAERAAAIALAQSKVSGDNGRMAARGVPELDPNAESSPNQEKELSQSRDISVDNAKGVRE